MYTILIIDDESSIRNLMKAYLSQSSYKTVLAKNAEEAYGLLSSCHIDTIISDIFMPGDSGVDLLKSVKISSPDIPVILITGMPDIEMTKNAMREGAFELLTKPVSKNIVIKTVDKAIQHKELKKNNIFFRDVIETIFSRMTHADHSKTCSSGIKSGKTNTIEDKCSRDSANCSKKCCNLLTEAIGDKACIKQDTFQYKHLNKRTGLTRKNTIEYDCYVDTTTNETQPFPTEQYEFYNMIGISSVMQKVFNRINDLSDTDASVIISGASGTGKELVAKALHFSSIRAENPMVTVNCSALSRHLLESELFGHTKGAFTGAVKDKIGRFQAADGGTIFLDEIGDISPDIQIKLLRVLQEQTFEQVGDSKTIKVNVRVIAATNKNLKSKMLKGEFREDLYYRLNVVEISLPDLKNRPEDIPILASFFFNRFLNCYNRPVKKLSKEVLTLFACYPWPGNVREFEHAIEHAFVICHENEIKKQHLPEEIRDYIVNDSEPSEKVHHSEADKVLYILHQTGWNKAKTARILGISRPTLYQKIVRHKLEKKQPFH